MSCIKFKLWKKIKRRWEKIIYTKKGINAISFIVTIILCLIINGAIKIYQNPKDINLKISLIKKEEQQSKEDEEKIEEEQIGNWYIEIPSINLKAPIAEGVEAETLNLYVGHFGETSKQLGNIGLAAHNRGYEKNYFENLKKVKEKDEIKYKNNEFEKTYIVERNEIIKNTDWSYLEEDDENKITLITCVENEPEYRRCIQALEKEEEIYWKNSWK